jgi:rhodanese-related sulfurtransferase
MKNLLLSILLSGCILSAISCQQKSTTNSTLSETQSASNTDMSSVKDISIAETKTLLAANKDIILLDVRTPAEIANGVIPGAMTIDFRADGFAEKVSTLDKDKTYVVYCQSGIRSAQAAALMKEQGFVTIYNMLGGYGAWE